MKSSLAQISDDKKVAVIQVGYQLLVSAKQRPLDQTDDKSIDLLLEYCGFDQSPIGRFLGNTFWEKSVMVNPYECFDQVASFDRATKAAVKEMLFALAQIDNQYMRQDIAMQLVQRLGL